MKKMKNQKQKSKKMTMDKLAVLMKQGFKKNQEEMAIMVGNAFQGTQDLFVEKFNLIDKRFDILTGEMNKNFKNVNEEINKANLNAVDVVRKEEFNALEVRVVRLEEAPVLPSKKS